MTNRFNRTGKLILPAAALSLCVIGFAAGSDAHSASAGDDLPLTCEINVSKGRYGHTYEGIVHATEAVRGTYELNIQKNGGGGSAVISQSGDFRLPAAGSDSLGEATFGGMPPNAVNASLTVHWNGHRLMCSNQSDI